MKMNLCLFLALAVVSALDYDEFQEEELSLRSGDIQWPSGAYEDGKFESVTDEHPEYYVASVRVYPTEVHLCSGSFIKANVLVVTARCIIGRTPDNMIVVTARTVDQKVNGSTVSQLVPHPKFEADPDENDIGLVITDSDVTNARVHQLPPFAKRYRGSGTVYAWNFYRKEFILTSHNVTLISEPKCSLLRKEYVGCDSVCGRGQSSVVVHGQFDDGIPLSAKRNDTVYLIGIYNAISLSDSESNRYYKIYPYNEWITTQLQKYAS